MLIFYYPFRQCVIVLLCLISFMPLISKAVDVKDFGAKGDGTTDDTKAILAAIDGAVDGVIEFPRGTYRITKTIEINLSQNGTLGLSGRGASACIRMEGEGPAFRFVGSHDKGSALPASVKPITWEKERMPLVDALEILGAHPNANGIEFKNTIQATVRALLVRNVRIGIHFTSRNRNVLIDGCHVYNASGIGIYLDKVNIHQMIISDSHISYCKKGGIRVDESEIRDFQITGNDIEYNCDPEGEVAADIWIDCSRGGSVREGTIAGNTIQAIPSPGGANIRFTGLPGNADKIGLWNITGNHISNQEVNIHLDHSRGISISGNTFIRGYDRHLIIDDSRNIIVNANVFDHNADYFPANLVSLGGISVARGQNIVLNDNIIEGAEYGNETAGGALTLVESSEITLSGNQIKNPKYRGIYVDRSSLVRITDCLIVGDAKDGGMLAGIALEGTCPGTVIRDNSIKAPEKNAIVNRAKGAVVESNTVINTAP